MRTTFATTLAASLMATPMPAVSEEDLRALTVSETANLSDLLWQTRPILIFAAKDDPRLTQQLGLFSENRAEMEDRDNVIIVIDDPDAPLRRRYQPDDFTVILIGKDGGEKLRRNGVVDPSTLNTLIDTMPMRRQEKRQVTAKHQP